MKCPACLGQENKVVDSRLGKEGNVIRRRRECLKCRKRFTTYERIEEQLPMVIKKDGRREPFDKQKVMIGIEKACEKRPISVATREDLVSRIERLFQTSSEKEIASSVIGEKIMRDLYDIDEVAYVRFASVYRQFKDISEFKKELEGLLNEKPAQKKLV